MSARGRARPLLNGPNGGRRQDQRARFRRALGCAASAPRVPVLAVTIVAVLLSLPQLVRLGNWLDPDSFIYEAQVLELRGMSQDAALRTVSTGPLATARLRLEANYITAHPGKPRHVGSLRWLTYTAKFDRRRWVVPALAAAMVPLFAQRSLQIASVLGYVLSAPLLFLLLRRRFSVPISLLTVLVCIALPMFRDPSIYPGTDSFGVAMETAALLAALVVVERGLHWLPLWIGGIAALAFTRDATVVPLAAVGWLLLRERTRTHLALMLTGVVVALPPLLVFGTPLREELAYTFSGFNIPRDASWSFVLHRLPSFLKIQGHYQVSYLVHHPVTTLVFAVGLAFVYLARSRSRYFSFHRAAGAAALVLVYLIPQLDNHFRFELVLIPIVAVGFAAGLEHAWSVIRPRLIVGTRRPIGTTRHEATPVGTAS